MTKKDTTTKKKRNLASGFGDVAKINDTISDDLNFAIKTEIKSDTENSINHDGVINKNDVDDTLDVIDNILGKKKSTRVQRGIYLDHDVDAAINKLTKGAKKGIKSDVINALLKEGLQKRGAL